jgi:glycerol uptake facilitator-like aquaporin
MQRWGKALWLSNV